MASQRHEISLRVLKNILRVSAPFELFQHEFSSITSSTTTTPKCTLHSVLFTKVSHHCDYNYSTVMNHEAVGGRQLYY